MDVRIAPEVAARFPDLHLAWARVEALHVAGPRHPEAKRLQEEAEAWVREHRTAEGLKEDPLFRSYRDFYWKLGIDPTKTRPSGEALNRRVLNGKDLPSINAFVDAYNAASLVTGVPLGAYDADRIEATLQLRLARASETFHGIGQDAPRTLEGGELVLSDARRIINFYPYRDADATRITERTTRAVLVACGAPGIDPSTLQDAVERAARNVLRTCGGGRVEEA